MNDIFNLILAVTVFQFLFLAIILFFKREPQSSNRLFSLFLFGKGITLLLTLLYHNYYQSVLMYLPIILSLYSTPLFFYAPFLYLFTKSILDKNFRVGKKVVLHLFPSIVFLILGLINHYFIQYHNIFILNDQFILATTAIYYIQAITYTILSIRELLKFRTDLKNYFSEIEKLKQSLLMYILVGFFFAWIVFLSGFLLTYLTGLNSEIKSILESIGLLILFFNANIIAYKLIQHPFLLSEFKGVIIESKSTVLPKVVNEQTAKRLKSYMQENRPFLNPSVTINDIAAELDLHPRSLSLLIKHSFNQNFFDFINEHRINEAKSKLANDKKDSTILEILYECGFNSKSAFNNAFKKFTGFTPTTFRNTQKA